MISKHEREIQAIEIVKKLNESPANAFMFALQNDPKCLTSNGRLNLSAIGRYLGVPSAQVNKMLASAKDMETSLFGKI